MNYVLLNIHFTGNDDAEVVGFVAREVESAQEWRKQIQTAIEHTFEKNDGSLEIYHSDNCSTTFESVEEVLDTFTMINITKEDFLVLSTLFGGKKNVVSYGQTEEFLEYSPPKMKEKVNVIHGKVVEEVLLYCRDNNSDKVYHVQLEKVKGGHVVNYQNGKRDGKLTQGTKTEMPISYDNAKEIFDALVKSKNKYTTNPSGVLKVNQKKMK